MLARERQNKIVEMVNANGSVLVKELSEVFLDNTNSGLASKSLKIVLEKIYHY